MGDTGADVSVIARAEWPAHLPLMPVQDVWGVGGKKEALQSVEKVTFVYHSQTDGNKQFSLRPYVLPIPFSIWGRDILQQMEATLQTNL